MEFSDSFSLKPPAPRSKQPDARAVSRLVFSRPSMDIPARIIQKLDKLLGTSSQPYRIFSGHEWIDTNCIVWPIPHEIPNPILERDQKLENSLSQAEQLLQNAPQQDYEEYKVKLASGLLWISAWSNMFRKQGCLFTRVRKLLDGIPVIVYKGDLTWVDITSTMFGSIVVAPFSDQFDILRIEQTYANNRDLTNEEVITKLKTLDETYGIDITGAGSAAVEFMLKRIPRGKEARELGEWLFDFCPDIYEVPRGLEAPKLT